MNPSYEDLIVQLETISERLGDRSIDILHEAIARGATGRPAEDKLIGRARNAVDKAASLLRQIGNEPDD